MSINGKPKRMVRILVMSRLDFGSRGYRRGLWKKAAQRGHEMDCNLGVMLGGLVDGRAHEEEVRDLKRQGSSLLRLARAVDKHLAEIARKLVPLSKWKMKYLRMKPISEAKRSELVAEQRKLATERKDIERQFVVVQQKLTDRLPENMADRIAKDMPEFSNAKDERIKIYIVASKAYDRKIGIDVARLLVQRHHDHLELRLKKPGVDRIRLRDGHVYVKEAEVMAPQKAPWRGDYFSAPVDRVRKDRIRQTSHAKSPDLQLIGGFGVLVNKPKGEATEPYIGCPALSNFDVTTASENQVGVLVVDVFRDQSAPVVHSFPFKDMVSRERTFITIPPNATPAQKKCIEEIKAIGELNTGMLAEAAGLSWPGVRRALTPYLVKKGDPVRKNWPGLIYDPLSDGWDFNYDWIRQNLEYPDPVGVQNVDSIVAVACVHAGSHQCDYHHHQEAVPEAIENENATVYGGAGDFVEGTAHRGLERRQIYGGFNITEQEMLAGWMTADNMFKPFKNRLPVLLEAKLKERGGVALVASDVRSLVDEALVPFWYIEGNHDSWAAYGAQTPLINMLNFMQNWLNRNIRAELERHGLTTDFNLPELISGKIMTSTDGRFTLKSGLPMAMWHPSMARAKTVSLRPQELLDMFADCSVVIGANFHVGMHLEVWNSNLGQRICVQIGTMKHSSPFEDSKMKIVDQGFISTQIYSVKGEKDVIPRIVRTTTTFHSNEAANPKRLDSLKPLKDLCEWIGLHDVRDFRTWKAISDAFKA